MVLTYTFSKSILVIFDDMRHLTILFFCAVFFCACKNDSVSNKPASDSVPDTSKKNVAVVDSQHNDSVTKIVTPTYDCSVLNRRLPNDSNVKQIRKDLQDLVHCGIDSFDLLYVVPNLLPGYMSENHVQGEFKVTYGDFIKHMNEFKATPAYEQLHERVETLDSLRSIPFDVNKVSYMKPVLGHLGFTEQEWEMFEGFSRTYPIPKKKSFTWGDMVEAFDKYKPETN